MQSRQIDQGRNEQATFAVQFFIKSYGSYWDVNSDLCTFFFHTQLEFILLKIAFLYHLKLLLLIVYNLKFFLLIFFCRPCFIDTNSSNDLQVWLYWLLVICLADYIPEGQLTRNEEEDLIPKFSWARYLSGLFKRKFL